MGLKSVPQLFQLGAQFEVIVNFTIEDDAAISVLRQNGLIAGIEVNDFEASGAQGKEFRLEYALLVRAAMDERFGCLANT
jgi:hypothetical protein